MTLRQTHLDVTLRLHLSGNVAYTTQAMNDPPQPELTSFSLDDISLLSGESIEGLDGVRAWREVELHLWPQSPSEDRFLRFKENLLTALNGEAEEALLEDGQ